MSDQGFSYSFTGHREKSVNSYVYTPHTYHVVGGIQSGVFAVRIVGVLYFRIQDRFYRIHIRQVHFATVLRAPVFGFHPVWFPFRETLEIVITAFVVMCVIVERRATPTPQLPVAFVKLSRNTDTRKRQKKKKWLKLIS